MGFQKFHFFLIFLKEKNKLNKAKCFETVSGNIVQPFIGRIWWLGSEVAQMNARRRMGGPCASGSSSGKEEGNAPRLQTLPSQTLRSKLHKFPESHKATTVS